MRGRPKWHNYIRDVCWECFSRLRYVQKYLRKRVVSDMMTSSNGNISRVTGLCAGNSPVTGEFPSQRPVTRSFGVLCDLRLNKRLSKQSWDWWLETPRRSLWRHCNERGNVGIKKHTHKTSVILTESIDTDNVVFLPTKWSCEVLWVSKWTDWD